MVYALVLLLTFTACKTNTFIVDSAASYDRIDYLDSKEDREVANMIAPYKAEMEEKMNQVVGVLPVDLVKARPNSTMGNWFTDALITETNRIHPEGADFAIQNYGGLRIPSLAKGPITKGNVYEMMPFDNMLVILEMDGATTQRLLDKIAASGGWPVSHQLKMTIRDGKASDIYINDEPFDSNRTYRVAMPDYIANGGDGADFLTLVPQDNSGIFIRDIVLQYLAELERKGEAIIVDSSKRINND